MMPSRSETERLEALREANRIRSIRARFKERVRVKPILLAAAIDQQPEWLLTARVESLLLVVPKFGPSRVGKILRVSDVSPSKTVGGLSPFQRKRLVGEIWRHLDHLDLAVAA